MADWSDWALQLRTLQRMLQLRGYGSVAGIMHGSDPLLVCSARDPQGGLVFVYFIREHKVGVKTLRRVQAESEASGCRHCIAVTEDGFTPFALKELEDPEKVGGVRVEVFKKRELAFCLMDHALVPRHELLSPAEKKALLQKLGAKASHMPRIKESDAVVRFMHFPPGSVVRIHRSIGSCQETYYRLVTA
jgi:DNA-directed RNA polymerases I, II, and III subunit RPABC1